VILFAQGDDQISGGGLFGLDARAGAGGEKEGATGVAAELVTENAEGARGVTEVAGGLGGRDLINKEGSQGLVLALFGVGGTEEKVLGVCYSNWCFYLYVYTVLHTFRGVKHWMSPQEAVADNKAALPVQTKIFEITQVLSVLKF